MIAILLLPLNFVVLAGLPGPGGASVIELTLGFGALAGFGWLVRRASAVRFDPPLAASGVRTRAALPLAVLGCAGSVLVVPRLPAGSWGGMLLLTVLPTLCSAGAAGWLLLRLSRAATFTTRQTGAVFVFLGSAGFAAAVALDFWSTGSPMARVLPDRGCAAAVLGVPGLSVVFSHWVRSIVKHRPKATRPTSCRTICSIARREAPRLPAWRFRAWLSVSPGRTWSRCG